MSISVLRTSSTVKTSSISKSGLPMITQVLDDGGFASVAAVETGSTISYETAKFDANGKQVGPALPLDLSGLQSFATVNIAPVGPSDYLIFWVSETSAATSIQAIRFDQAGNATSGPFTLLDHAVSTSDWQALTPLANGGYVLEGWSGVQTFFILDADFKLVATAQSGQAFEKSTFAKIVSATPDGGFAEIAEYRPLFSTGTQIAVTKYRADGKIENSHIDLRAPGSTNNSGASFASLANGDFVLVWHSVTGQTQNIVGQRFHADGSEAGNLFKVTSIGSGGSDQSVIALDGGGFMVMWTPTQSGYNPSNLYGRIYAADGKVVGKDFRINETVDAGTNSLCALKQKDGTIFVAWLADNDSVPGIVVMGAHIDAKGKKIGGDFLIGSYDIIGDHIELSMHATSGNGVAVTWSVYSIIDRATQQFQRLIQPGDAKHPFTTGSDIVQGTSGSDVFHLLPSQMTKGDQLHGGAGTDTLVIDKAGTTDFTSADVIDGVEKILGTAGSDVFIIDTNVLKTKITFDGGSGNDTVIANDLFNSNVHFKNFEYLKGTAGDDVLALSAADLNSFKSIDGGAGFDELRLLTGGKLDMGKSKVTGVELLRGSSQKDVLIGTAKGEYISGLDSNDILTGGHGRDIFIFEIEFMKSVDPYGPPFIGENIDTITDFSVKDDTIALYSAIFTRLGGLGTLTASAFAKNSTGKAGDASDRIIYETDTGKLFYDPDGTGKLAAAQFATLSKGLALTYADFVVI